MPRAGPKKVQRYSLEVKADRGAVEPATRDAGAGGGGSVGHSPVHAFALAEGSARWGVAGEAGQVSQRVPPAREIARLQELERAHALLQEEHALLKKAIRFCSARRPTRSPSSTRSEGRSL